MIILDTNVISAFMKAEPDVAVVLWLDRQPAGSIWTTSITVFEIEYGLQRLSEGKRRQKLADAFAAMLREDLGGRVLPFDSHAAVAAGAVAAAIRAQGRMVDVRDVQIAGIARVRQASVATRNVRDFELACDVQNPWQGA